MAKDHKDLPIDTNDIQTSEEHSLAALTDASPRVILVALPEEV